MRIYIDENLPPRLAEGLAILEGTDTGVEIFSIKKEFGQGVADEAWIPLIGQLKGVAITQDYNIHRTRSQLQLYQNHKIGLFIISPPSKKGFTYWELVQILINNWAQIKHLIETSEKPFAFQYKLKGKFKKLN